MTNHSSTWILFSEVSKVLSQFLQLSSVMLSSWISYYIIKYLLLLDRMPDLSADKTAARAFEHLFVECLPTSGTIILCYIGYTFVYTRLFEQSSQRNLCSASRCTPSCISRLSIPCVFYHMQPLLQYIFPFLTPHGFLPLYLQPLYNYHC